MSEERFVVLSTLLNDWHKGDVITRAQLRFANPARPEEVYDGHDRLVSLGAIRPLLEHEEGLARVPLPSGGLSAEASLRLAQQDATIDQLTRAVTAVEDRLAFHAAAAGTLPGAAAPEADPAVAAAIAEREARVGHLARRLEAATAQLDQAQGVTRQADEARARAAHEARGGREMPTGQAGALASLGPPGEQHAGAAGAGEAGPSSPAPSPPPSPAGGAEVLVPPAEQTTRARRGRPSRQAEPTPPEAPKGSEASPPEPGAGELLFPPKE
jgi:hypothetical protein